MSLPGFTAEASFYQSNGYYHRARICTPRSQSWLVLPQLRPNPFGRKLCEDTAWCLNEPSNPCNLTSRGRADLRDWYINNCGGIPDLVA
jgi:hypothetical protein